jgi:hypothetical protein
VVKIFVVSSHIFSGNEVAQWVGVVMTDGHQSFGDRADEARGMSIKILAITIGETIDMSNMTSLAGTEANVFSIKNYTALRSVMNSLVKFFCESPCQLLYILTLHFYYRSAM